MPDPGIPIRDHHTNRINHVFQFIEDNIDKDLSLEEISKIACFSPFHFHRIFKAITGETLNEYVTRKRVERAASYLMHRESIEVNEIAYQNGFKDHSTFSRTFKRFYGDSPTAFRQKHSNSIGRLDKSKNHQIVLSFEKYLCNMDHLLNWINMNAKIEIKMMPKMELAYVTSIGEQGIMKAYETLMNWAVPKGILDHPDTKMLTLYHDSFKITEPEKVRMIACVVLNEPMETNAEVGLTSIEEGKCIVSRFEIGLEEFEKSWSGLFIWMKENGYKKADRKPFEIYHNDFRKHPDNKCIVDFCIPIE